MAVTGNVGTLGCGGAGVQRADAPEQSLAIALAVASVQLDCQFPRSTLPEEVLLSAGARAHLAPFVLLDLLIIVKN